MRHRTAERYTVQNTCVFRDTRTQSPKCESDTKIRIRHTATPTKRNRFLVITLTFLIPFPTSQTQSQSRNLRQQQQNHHGDFAVRLPISTTLRTVRSLGFYHSPRRRRRRTAAMHTNSISNDSMCGGIPATTPVMEGKTLTQQQCHFKSHVLSGKRAWSSSANPSRTSAALAQHAHAR